MIRKRGTMSTDQILKLVLAIGAVSILLILVGKLLFSSESQSEMASDSYFEAFMREVETADNGGVGEFSMWQDERDKGKFSVFLVYFGDRFSYDASFGANYNVTFITYGRNNIACVCFWDGEEAVCKRENCANLDYPMSAELGGYSTLKNEYGQWAIGDKQSITIEKVEEEYVVTETTEFDASFNSVYIGDIEVGDVLYTEEGVRCRVISSEYDYRTRFWWIELDRINSEDENDCKSIEAPIDALLGDWSGGVYRLE